MTKRRHSKQRDAILKLLQNSTDHPTADEIYLEARKYIPQISLGTVYRNLDLLQRDGRVFVITSPGQPRRYDGNTEKHYHIRCNRCGTVKDVPPGNVPVTGTVRIPGFIVTNLKIQLEGLCAECQDIDS